jgi:5,10-methylenetetrahydrofolate reductase
MIIPLADALRSRPFSIMVELVASGLKREAQVLEIASNLATIPDVVAGSVTSYAGGGFGQDSVRVGTAVRARGLTPNVHLTCVNQDRPACEDAGAPARARDVQRLRAHRATGRRGRDGKPVFDSTPCSSSSSSPRCAPSRTCRFTSPSPCRPSSTQREDCLYQYLKLEKKIAAGANLAITQVGWDARKFAELKRISTSAATRFPVLGNVYVLSRRAAEKMATGAPRDAGPPPALVEQVRRESEAPDGGSRRGSSARPRRWPCSRGSATRARTSVARTTPTRSTSSSLRARELEPQWQECAERLQFGDPGGFYLDAPARQRPARTMLPGCSTRRAGRCRCPGRSATTTRRCAGAPGALPLGRSPSGAPRCRRAARVLGQAAGLRLRGLRQLRARAHGVRLPADLPEADAQRALRRHAARPLRGGRSGVHLGVGVPARRRRRPRRRPEDVHPRARPPAPGHQFLGELLREPRQPAGPAEAGRRVDDPPRAGARGQQRAPSTPPFPFPKERRSPHELQRPTRPT